MRKDEAIEFDEDLEEAMEKRASKQKAMDKLAVVHGDTKIGDLRAPNITL